jgi:ABC-2 type transport system permease protein
MWSRLFRAEWRKIIGNRWATGCMIWIFPALAVLVTGFALLVAALSSNFRAEISRDPAVWTDIAITPWAIPTNPLGRMLLLGFTAVLFAGEYQWNTWKVIVPRSQRVPLILVKFFAVALFIIFAFTLMSILLTAGIGLVSLVAGASYGPPIDSDVLRDFAEDYGLQMLSAFMTTIIAAGYAALTAMITRSILGSAVVGIVVSIGETLLFLPLSLIGHLLDTDSVVHIYRFLPGYNLNNLFSWLFNDADSPPEGIEFPSGKIIVDSQLFSEVMLICWVVGLVVLTAYLFQRQDVTN